LTNQLRKTHGDTRDRLVEAAQRLFFEQGYEFTGLAQIRKAARANSGSLHYFFPSKEDLLAAVLEKYKSMLGTQILEPAYEEASDPIERIFAILSGYRKLLRATDFGRGCPIGNLAPEVCNNHSKLRRLIVENFQVWCGTIEGLIKEASDRLPAKTKPRALALHVLATMEGGVMLARAYRSVEPFDQAVNHLKDYFCCLLRDRAEYESKRVSGDSKVKEKSK
jgi:AcrR family transcriptional regulator